MRRTIVTLLACAAMVVAQLQADAEQYNPRVGQRHRDFTLPAISGGQPVSLSDYRGKKVLLIQFASW